MDNIKSSRLSFQDFAYQTDFEESPYFPYLRKPIDRKRVLIFAAQDDKHMQNAVKAAQYLSKKKFRVCVNFPVERINGKTKGIFEVENKSDEFFEALASSKYIIAQKSLPADFIKREDQVVINDIVLKGSSLKKRIARNLNNCKTDYFIKNEYRKSGLSFNKTLKRIKKGKLVAKEKKSLNKELLFVLNHKIGTVAIDLFERISNQLDPAKYAISLLIDNSFLASYEKKLSTLNPNIKVFVKKGKFLRSVEDDKKIAFLNKEIGFIENINCIEDFVPDYIFDFEERRLTGTARFDIVFNIGFNNFYWIWLCKQLAKEKLVCIEANDYTKNPETAVAKANMAAIADEIYFLTCDDMDIATALVEEIRQKSRLLNFIPIAETEKRELKQFQSKNGARLITSIASYDIFDSFSVQSVPFFDKKDADCIIIDNSVPAKDMRTFVKAVAERNEKRLFVIDVFNHLRNSNINNLIASFNLTYITSSDIYAPLLPMFDKCYLMKKNPGIQYEIEKNGVTPVIFNIESGKESSVKHINYQFDMNI